MKKIILSLFLSLVLLPSVNYAQVEIVPIKEDLAITIQLEKQLIELQIAILKIQIAQLIEQIRLIKIEKGLTDEPVGADIGPEVFDSPAYEQKQKQNRLKKDLQKCLVSGAKGGQSRTEKCNQMYGGN
jgi:hypothetical protein